jgi:putative ubiquitin-RnfH superfamily antitoxin RatB of RatAB toxin-antitoxin module
MDIIELIYPLPDQQDLFTQAFKKEQTVQAAIEESKILQRYPELDLATMVVGIFGKKTKMTQILRVNDRIEIYRPLIADPKEVRKRKAAQGKKLKKGGVKS